VATLDLRGNDLGDSGAEALAVARGVRPPQPPGPERVRPPVRRDRAGPQPPAHALETIVRETRESSTLAPQASLAAHPATTTFRHLRLDACGVGERGVRALCHAADLGDAAAPRTAAQSLDMLDLSDNGLDGVALNWLLSNGATTLNLDDLDLRVDPGDDHSPKRAARTRAGGQNADPNRARRPRAAPSFDDDATKRLWKLAVRR